MVSATTFSRIAWIVTISNMIARFTENNFAKSCFTATLKITIHEEKISHFTFHGKKGPITSHENTLFCLHYSTGTHNTTMFIYGRVGQPSHRAVYLTYMHICINNKYYINKRTEAPKPDTKTPKNQQVEKTRGTCTPDQGSGATLGVLGYASA